MNVAHVERLMAAGRMQPAGLAAFAARTPERTGIYSFEQEPGMLSSEELATFTKQRRAWKYFQEAAASYRRTSTHWVSSAKRAETRAKRLAELIACSDRHERIPSLRPTPRRAR
ncbi:MAG: YdeI/OmpD-associated family protein [Gemmatimonadetes bacterium]|nr:YdeI/OmpD-associated family protein [Gemmatimonadota bacterium]